MKYIVVFITVKSRKEAQKISRQLVKEKLAAGASIVNGISSLYWWNKKIRSSGESLIILRTAERMFNSLAQRVKEMHSYEVPEIIALPIVKGNKPYLFWIAESMRAEGV